VFLLWMLAATLRRDIANRAFENFQQRLLHALARNIARDGNIFGLARNLVDFIDIDNSPLRALHVVVGVLQQPQDDILNVLAYVAGLSQRGGIGDREWHIENLGQRAGEQSFARAGRPDHEDVAFFNLDLGVRIATGGLFWFRGRRWFLENALVVIMNGHGQGLLGMLLPDTAQIELALDLRRFGNVDARFVFPGL